MPMQMVFDVARVRIWLACGLTCITILAGCTGRHTAIAPDVAGVAPAVAPEAALWPLSFPRVATSAAPPGTFKYRRSGADYASDLDHSHLTTTRQMLELTPVQPGAPSFADAAYCVYRMRCYRDAETASLSFTWAGDAPAPGECWIGLPDWAHGRWAWQALPEGSQLALDPASAANEFHQCFVAVVLTGGAPRQLDAVQLACAPDGLVEYTLFPPQQGIGTFLLDHDQNTAKRWESAYLPNSAAYLLDNGHLLRTCINDDVPNGRGRLEEYDWDLNLVWHFDDIPAGFGAHHDIAPMPNGNILVLVQEQVSKDDAVQAGVDPDSLVSDYVIDGILEIKPLPDNSGEIVWVWRALDHLIQDFDPTKDNYGVVGDHPELLDANFRTHSQVIINTDFSHANSVDYNPELDQVMINFRSQSEFYVIDHSTTTEEAAGHAGGRCGRGGDFLYRWGNPQVYRQGDATAQQLFMQHDAEWIKSGCPGAGNILVFNNGVDRPGEGADYSTAVELTPPLQTDGNYAYSGGAYGPAAPVWVYSATPPTAFYSELMGGVQRLPNGNTLICIAMTGVLREVTPDGQTVWQYVNTHPYPSGTNRIFKAERYYLFGPDFPEEEQ